MLIRVDRYVFFHRLQLIQIESKVQILRVRVRVREGGEAALKKMI